MHITNRAGRALRTGASLGLALLLPACASGVSAQASSQASTQASAQTTPNTLTAAEKASGWKLLFDGRTFNGWREYKADTMPVIWSVVDGAMVKGNPSRALPGRDIVSRELFGNFEFAFDWKLSEAGNAGVFYRATEEYDKVYWSAPEYQLLDNVKGADNKTPFTRAGAAYQIKPAPDGHDKLAVWAMPRDSATNRSRALTTDDVRQFLNAGEWNQSRIVVKGDHVEHWLNGFKLVEYDLSGAEWDGIIKASKFTPYPNFGKAKRGFFAFQGDHGGLLALRNVKVRELK
ncbi:MAG: DUF1080 domain-containing protein [Gemmatimonadota bacterium]